MEELLGKPASEWLVELLAFQPTGRESAEGLHRWEMLQTVEEAVRNDSAWGLDLADAMAMTNDWDNDLWPHVLMAWKHVDFTADDLPKLLRYLRANALQEEHIGLVVDTLSHVVQKGNGIVGPELLLEINAMVKALQPYGVDGTGA